MLPPTGPAITTDDKNLSNARLESNVAEHLGQRLVTGTLHASWGVPESGCTSYIGLSCVSAEINVTFRLETSSGTCFADSDCVAPLTCDPIGYVCLNR